MISNGDNGLNTKVPNTKSERTLTNFLKKSFCVNLQLLMCLVCLFCSVQVKSKYIGILDSTSMEIGLEFSTFGFAMEPIQ